MVRSFDATPVDPEWLDALCATAMWAPTAGNSAGVRMHTIIHSMLPEYLAVATDDATARRSRRFEGLARAGAAVLVTSRAQDYVRRYCEPDKAGSGLDEASAWPIPYWHTDAAMATMALLLLIEEGGWAATIWGNFRHEAEVLEWAGIEGESLFATVLVGRPDGRDEVSPSLTRVVPSRVERVRRV